MTTVSFVSVLFYFICLCVQVLSKVECEARQQVLLTEYIGTVEVEALSMIDLIQQHVIPSVQAAGALHFSSTPSSTVSPYCLHLEKLQLAVKEIHKSLDAIHPKTSPLNHSDKVNRNDVIIIVNVPFHSISLFLLSGSIVSFSENGHDDGNQKAVR